MVNKRNVDIGDTTGWDREWICPTCFASNYEPNEVCYKCGEIEKPMLKADKDSLQINRGNAEIADSTGWNRNSVSTTSLQNIKESNPKDSIGVKKASMSYVPAPVLMEAALGMMEGGFKYRRHNYRVIGVRASVYYDATIRHLMSYWEGENIDPKSGISHLSKAIASLIVWRDAEMNNKYVDDRPPKFVDQDWLEKMNAHVEKLMEMYPNGKPPYTELDKSEK